MSQSYYDQEWLKTRAIPAKYPIITNCLPPVDTSKNKPAKPQKFTNGMTHKIALSMDEFLKLSKIYVANLMGCNVEDIESVSVYEDGVGIHNDNFSDYQLCYTFKIPMTPEAVKASNKRAEASLKDRRIDLTL